MTQAAARFRSERINIAIIKNISARRAGIGLGNGARPVLGAARGAVDLVELSHTVRDGVLFDQWKVERLTDRGAHTARRRLPVVLSGLAEGDPRRIAAHSYACAVEAIGSMGGASAEGQKVDGGPASNDGGASTRMMHAETIRAVEVALSGRGDVIRPHIPNAGGRRAIGALDLMRAICLQGVDVRAVLSAHGWSGQSRDALKLIAAALTLLEVMADALDDLHDVKVAALASDGGACVVPYKVAEMISKNDLTVR